MIKRLTVVLSVACAGVGAWVLSRGHAQVSACDSYVAHLRGTSASTLCSRAESSYLLGVTLTMGGLVITTLVLFAMYKKARAKNWGKTMPTIPQSAPHVVGSMVP
ncbi:MAG: hypothetical protein KGJ36_06165 [Acidobacteriota bacterium]|nr:hypothetical protein [Acidobacteriota bacterium]